MRDERMIKRLVQTVILRFDAAARNARGNCGRVENRRKIDALGFPVGIDPIPAVALEFMAAFRANFVCFWHAGMMAQSKCQIESAGFQTVPLPNGEAE